jgi:hypothetical protein
MALTDGEKKNFDTLQLAQANGDLCLVETTIKGTGERVVLICAMNISEDDGVPVYEPLPLGELYTKELHPYDVYDSPVDDMMRDLEGEQALAEGLNELVPGLNATRAWVESYGMGLKDSDPVVVAETEVPFVRWQAKEVQGIGVDNPERIQKDAEGKTVLMPTGVGEPEEETFTFTVNKRQMRVIRTALDTYARLGMGQLEVAVTEFLTNHFYARLMKDRTVSATDEHPISVRTYMTSLINEVKRVVFGHPPNGSWGIFNEEVPSDCREAYDIRQIVGKSLVESDMEEGIDRSWDVDNRFYLPTNPEEPPITIERKK